MTQEPEAAAIAVVAEHRRSALLRARRRAALATLVTAVAALGVALLVPNLYSDPNGVDPFTLRLTATALVLAALAITLPRLAASRPVLVALAAITAAWTAWLSVPSLLGHIGVHVSFVASVLWAAVAMIAVTLAIPAAAWWRIPLDLRPPLRLRSLRLPAAAALVGGTLLLVLGFLLIPATLLGRQGVALIALGRDGPWLGPASVLQAVAQEVQFRGLLQGALERVLPRHLANLGQALFFGLAHLAIVYEGPLGPLLPITVAVGFVLGWITQRTGSLWPAIAVHAVADVLVTLAVLPGLYGY